MAVFTSPPAASSAAAASAGGRPVAVTTMRRARSTSFSLPADTSTMRFPKVRPRRTIVTVEIVLSTSFWAAPALRRVEPAITSGPTTTSMAWSAAPEISEPGWQASADGQRSGLPGGAERAEHVGRAAAGADADDGVGRADAEGGQLGGTGGGVVLGALLRLA